MSKSGHKEDLAAVRAFSSKARSRFRDIPFVFLDVETTGLSPSRGDRIIEIAMARSLDGSIVDTYASLVNPEQHISPGASSVNGIYDRDVAEAPRFADIADAVNDFLSEAVIVCHNAPFDLEFVSSEMKRAHKQFFAPRVLDTLQIARANYAFGSNGLQNLARTLRIPTKQAHRALGDVLTTHAVFSWFVADLWRDKAPTLEALFVASGRENRASAPALVMPPEIEEAFSGGRKLQLEYVDVNGLRSKRWVTPRQIVERRDAVYLIAYCHLRRGERSFRMDRIVNIVLERE